MPVDYRKFKNVVEPGNIDLYNRPIVHNADGTISTEKSFSIGTDKGETLIPQVVGGKMLSQQDAIQHYKDTGEHLGIFKDVPSANAAAEAIHNRGQPMAYQDDLLNAAQRRRTRTGNSYFPAANTYRGININAGPSANAINSTPQGQTIMPSRYGTSSAVLPPDQNPAYQAAIAKGRPNMNDYTWITTPSGGQMRVPTASVGNLLKPGTSLTGSQVTQVGNQAPIDRAAAYARGYGAPTPNVQNFAGGPALVQGGVANPVENLTPQQRVQYGQGGTLDLIKTNPSLNYAVNALSGFGRNIASWFGGGNTPSIPASANAGIPSPSPTPYQTPNPSPTASPTATPTPFKVADGRSDLLKDTDNIFYGGGNAPIPTPTPTPGPNLMAYNPPRRYSDYGYY